MSSDLETTDTATAPNFTKKKHTAEFWKRSWVFQSQTTFLNQQLRCSTSSVRNRNKESKKSIIINLAVNNMAFVGKYRPADSAKPQREEESDPQCSLCSFLVYLFLSGAVLFILLSISNRTHSFRSRSLFQGRPERETRLQLSSGTTMKQHVYPDKARMLSELHLKGFHSKAVGLGVSVLDALLFHFFDVSKSYEQTNFKKHTFKWSIIFFT